MFNQEHLTRACHQIDLWLIYYRQIPSRQLPALHGLLSESEREQRQRYVFEDDRVRYLVTRAAVRIILSRYAAVAPGDWEFERNEYGRPKIAHCHAITDIDFNISHTHGLIAIAVGGNRAVGIDVENVVVRRPSVDIANHFFSAVEATELSHCREEHRSERFFEYWTLKESYIKARGMGLSLPLDRFYFRFPENGVVRVSFDDGLDTPEDWCFWQYRPQPEYLLALCARRQAGISTKVIVRSLTPLISEAELSVDWLRTSDVEGKI